MVDQTTFGRFNAETAAWHGGRRFNAETAVGIFIQK
jgi:hypothetical protein